MDEGKCKALIEEFGLSNYFAEVKVMLLPFHTVP